jgi:Raf kinase inhibitor-like YbhB/YbcL family protein
MLPLVSARTRRALSKTVAITAAGTIALAGCGGDDNKVKGPPPAAPEQIVLESPAFEEGGTIPLLYTCDGADLSPPLVWRRFPKDAKGMALLMEDSDAPGGTFVHWTWYQASDADFRALPESQAPLHGLQGKNSFGKSFYRGPCPPKGDKPHRYVFVLYALRSRPDLKQGASPGDVRAEVKKLAIARGVLTGTFGR